MVRAAGYPGGRQARAPGLQSSLWHPSGQNPTEDQPAEEASGRKALVGDFQRFPGYL